MNLALVALLPFLGAVFPSLVIRSGRNVCAVVTGLVSVSALGLLLTHAPLVYSGEVYRWGVEWLPQINLRFSFFVDGLGLFFATLILFIGILIIIYARYYLSREDPMGRFFAYLLLFQGAMVGITLSDNILLLLVFWELTSLSSFLLIGYWRHLPEGRQGARMALAVTGGGGLALIAGMLMLGQIAGSYELSEILERGDIVRESPWYVPMLLLILIGAFTKSAQFPFHFWLPHAMAAPTPVSAYLHSATMVKAGVFLLARLWPVLAGTDAWFLIVSMTGLVTMAVAAWIAVFKDDLKGLLAFSTVSHLGLMTMLLGFGTPAAAVVAVFHILNHATFKAALFMSAGIVDHEAGTRDIRRLGGLYGLMPISATLAVIAALSMAGVPLFNGFLSKEMMLAEVAETSYLGSPWVFTIIATAAALFSVAYSARFIFHVYFGPKRDDYPHKPHDPPAGMWLPVLVLVIPVIVIGILPNETVGLIVERTAAAVTGAPIEDFYLITLAWQGFKPAVVMSLVAIGGGIVMLLAYRLINAGREAVPRPDAKTIFDAGIERLVRLNQAIIDLTHNGSLQRYATVTVATIVIAGGIAFFSHHHGAGDRALLPVTVPAIAAWIILIVTCMLVVVRHHDRLTLLILTSVTGLMVSLAFLHFSAPDLALTQISVEVVTTILLLLALNLLPKQVAPISSNLVRYRDAGIAAVGGLGIAILAYEAMTRGFDSISGFHLAESKPGGGGTNVVNVILVDFRGYDTFGEIIVLGIAALTIYALLDSALRGEAARRLMAIKARKESAEAHPVMIVVATRILLPFAILVGVFIFLRGHNMPGGGFIAGLVVGIAFIMQYMASGYAWAASRQETDHHALIGLGVLIAGLTGIAAIIAGAPFLTSTFTYVTLPVVGTFEIASALAFDLGVFLTVFGVVLLSLASLSRVEQRIEQEPVSSSRPMDMPLENGTPTSGVAAAPNAAGGG